MQMGRSSRKYSFVTVAMLLMAFGGTLVFYLWTLNAVTSLYALQNLLHLRHYNYPSIMKDRLDVVLENASLRNKTVIIAMVNEAYVERDDAYTTNMLDLFLESFWIGEETHWLINHVLVVAVDEVAYRRCVFRGLHCYKLHTSGMDLRKERVYMSRHFIQMMWFRTLFLTQVLKKGYNFIFSDIDVLWLRNPLKILKTDLQEDDVDDIQFSVDYYNGDPKSASNPINTGFYFIRSNNKTISLFETWYSMKDHPDAVGLKEQDILQTLIRRGEVVRQLGLTVSLLDTRQFSGFCEVSKDPRVVVTVHANCCRYIVAKVVDLARVLMDWRRFRVLDKTTPFQWSHHDECLGSWDDKDESGVSLRSPPSVAQVEHNGFQSTPNDASKLDSNTNYIWLKQRDLPMTLMFRDKFYEV